MTDDSLALVLAVLLVVVPATVGLDITITATNATVPILNAYNSTNIYSYDNSNLIAVPAGNAAFVGIGTTEPDSGGHPEGPGELSDLARGGYFLLPLPPRSKQPPPDGWTARKEPYAIPETGNVAIGVRGDVAILITNDEAATAWATENFGRPNVRTPRGGHWYFRARPGQVNESNKLTPVGTIEFHVRNKYALIPQSIHPSGAAYQWDRQLPPVAELPEAPDLRELWNPGGEHHSKLLAMSAAKAHAGMDSETIFSELTAWRDGHLPDPNAHPDRGLRQMAESAYSKFHTEAIHAEDAKETAERTARPAKEAPEDSKPLRVVSAGSRGTIEQFPDRIDWVTRRERGRGDAKERVEERTTVVQGHIEVVSRLVSEGETYFVIRQDEQAVVQADALLKRLLRSGQVVHSGRARDALNLILTDATRDRIVSAHPAVGIYESHDGHLELCTNPVPLTDTQREATEDVATALEQLATGGPVTPTDADDYRSIITSFLPHEALPVAGLSAAAPFALVLRRHNVIVPHVFLFSEESGLGKSTLGDCFSESLYRLRDRSADEVESAFRVLIHADAAGLPLSVHEAEKLNAKGLGPAFKNAAERENLGTRGEPDLGHRRYRSRAGWILSGNRNDLKTQQTRVRFLVARFDPAQKAARMRRRREFDDLRSRLRPIGFEVLRHAIATFPTIRELLAEIARIRIDVEHAYESHWEDARRSEEWAVILFGLRMLASYARQLGTEFPVPDLPTFIHDVVAPVEAATFESADFSVLAIRRRLEVWIAKNTAFTRDEGSPVRVIRGDGELFRRGEITGRPGYWVTCAFLDELERELPVELRPNSFADFARSCADKFGLPRSEVLGSDGRGVNLRFGDSERRAAFVPLDEPERSEPEKAQQRKVDEVYSEGAPKSRSVPANSTPGETGGAQQSGNTVAGGDSQSENPATVARTGGSAGPPSENGGVLPCYRDLTYPIAHAEDPVQHRLRGP